jgi:hypothetical protein
MADESKVIVALRLVGAEAFAGAAKGATAGLRGLGDAGTVAAGGLGKAGSNATIAQGKLGKAHLAASRLGGALASVGKGVGVAAVAVSVATLGFAEVAKSAFEKVKSLGEAAAALHGIAGLSNNDAIQLAAVAQAVGVNTRPLGMSLKALSTQASQAAAGNKTSIKTFGLLGITMGEVKGTGGDLMKLFSLVAEHMEKTKGGANKVTAASKLLGRGWIALNPLLEGGGREMRSLTRFAGGLGITLGGNTAANLAKARDASYRWKLVMMAVQLFVVNKLIPALLAIATWINGNVIPAIRDIAKFMSGVVRDVKTDVDSIVGFISALPGRISKAATGLWDGLKSGLVAVINWIITQYNDLPLVHGFDLGPVHVPGLPKASPLGTGAAPKPAANPLIPGAGKTPSPLVPGAKPFGANLALSMPAAPLYANINLMLDSQVVHRGVYRVERARVEA